MRASLTSIADKSTVTASDSALLHEGICTAVDELKTVGWPVERIIVRLKEVAKEVGFYPPNSTHLLASEIDRREHVWGEIIKDCIERYYRV